MSNPKHRLPQRDGLGKSICIDEDEGVVVFAKALRPHEAGRVSIGRTLLERFSRSSLVKQRSPRSLTMLCLGGAKLLILVIYIRELFQRESVSDPV